MLAVGAVLGERLRDSRRKPLFAAAALLLCVALGGGGIRLANRGVSATPTLSAPLAAASTVIPPVAPTVAPTQQATRQQQATGQPTARATVAPPTEPPPTGTALPAAPLITPGIGGQPNLQPVVAALNAPTATAATAPTTPRGTTVIPILMYHYVRVVTDKSDTIGVNLSVTPANFAAQMKYLAESGYTTLTMREVYAILAGTQPLPPKPIALTFDDGYRDFYAAAWPVLRQYNFKATAYIVTSFIGNELYMTWPMLQELDGAGLVEIGAHTRSHADLRAQGKDKRWEEIVGSKAILEEGLGHPIASFCYPSGFYNAEVVADVRRAGYLTAVTTAYGSKLNLTNAFELPRVRVNGPDPLNTWVGKLP